MGRRLRNMILIGLAAVVGSVLGRYAARAHARIDSGEDPLGTAFEFNIRPQELVPGVVAAFRVGEPPWSWLHVPAWLAAFATNFAVTAVGGDLDRLRQTIEERAMGMFGIEPEREVEIHDVTAVKPPHGTDAAPATEPPSAREQPDPAYADAPQTLDPLTQPAPSSPASPSAGERTPNDYPSTIWTTGNATPSDSSRSDVPESETHGFTPFRD
jgi:hypothetical protein